MKITTSGPDVPDDLGGEEWDRLNAEEEDVCEACGRTFCVCDDWKKEV